MASGKLGTLAVYLTANTDGLKKGAKDANAIIGGMSSSLTKLAGFFGVGLGVAGTASSLKKIYSALDSIGKGADRIGVTTDAYQELRYAAGKTAVSMEQVEMATAKAGQAMEKAANGDKKMISALKTLGMTWQDLAGLSPDKQLEKIGAALAGLSDDVQRNNAAIAIFGESGTKLMPFFNGMQDLRKEAQALGVVISEDAIRKAEAAGDAFARMGDKITAMIADSGLIQWLDKVIIDLERVIDLATRGGRADFSNIDWDAFIADFGPVGTDYADTAKKIIGMATGSKPIMDLMKLYNGEYNKKPSGGDNGIQANQERKSTAIALIEQAKAEAEKEDADKKFSAEVLKLSEQNTLERMRQNGATEEQIGLMEIQYRMGVSLLSLSKEQRESLATAVRDQAELNRKKEEQAEVERNNADLQKKVQDEIIRKKEEQVKLDQQAASFRNYMTDRAGSLRQSMLKAGGYDQQALLEQRMQEAATRKGAALTGPEAAGVSRLAELEHKLNTLPQLNLNDLDVKTNELTRRGGFASGAVGPSMESINQKIAAAAQRQEAILRDMYQVLRQMVGG